jgi:hypothetical protein
MSERFMQYPYSLAKAGGFVSTVTGEFVKLNNNEKLVYVFMKSRNRFFTIEKGWKHRDKQQDIADALRLDIRSIATMMKKLIAHGVVTGEKQKYSNYYHWVYTDVADLKLWEEIDGKHVLIDEAVRSDDSEEIVENTPQKPTIKNDFILSRRATAEELNQLPF